ncbi:MAG TPA: fluoride efflux transporter CrcB [Vicinamibacterales bacterium]
MIWLLVAAGGAIGSVARYALSTFALRATGTLFPLGTFVVNAVGCLCFGVVVGAAEQRIALSPEARTFILAGVLGGFTTFSSYVFESAGLIRDGQMTAAIVNIAGQVVAGLAAFWIGAALGGLR